MSAILTALLFVTPVETAVDAERSFALMAQQRGQWTAFRHFADDEAILFTPDPVDAREALEGLDDPLIAVRWWPAHSWVSCDGTVAINSGPWVRAHQGSVGQFVTAWERQPDGSWRWIFDDGRDLDEPIAAGERPQVRRAACGDPEEAWRRASRQFRTSVPANGYRDERFGGSADGSLRWRWTVAHSGARNLGIWLFDGERMESVFRYRVAAPAR